MLMMYGTSGRILPIGGYAVDNFGDIVGCSRSSANRAWYHLGVWAVFPEVVGYRQISRYEFDRRGGLTNPALRRVVRDGSFDTYHALYHTDGATKPIDLQEG